MKKYLSVLFVLCLSCILVVGCSDKSTTTTEYNDPAAPPENIAPTTESIDIDLTVMSSTMVYAEVYNMMTNPAAYFGKTIKASGLYYASYYEQTGKYYHYAIIEDATACCSQGLEFIWVGNHNYPHDYPENHTKIEIIGVFGSYEELGIIYYYLTVDNLSVLS